MRSPRGLAASVRLVVAATLLAACGSSSAGAGVLSGTLKTSASGCARPLAGAEITLFEATETQPGELGKAVTNKSGRFEITSPTDTSSSIFFVTANLGNGVEFVTILGPDLPPSTTINELTTVAAAWSMAQFYRTGVIAGDGFALQLAAGMNDNIVSSATGESSPVLLSSPNADETNSLRLTRSLANLLAACVNHPLVRRVFFELTRPPGGSTPVNTVQALASLARNPSQNVATIYSFTKLRNAYCPALVRMPDAWTVTVKVNDSGNDAFLFGGPANIVFDAKGYAWVANNVVQGTTKSAKHIMVLKPNGQPADGANGTPTSPISGGGILGVGLGITLDPSGSVWVGNFGWGGDNPTTSGNGSISKISGSGVPLSVPNGYQGGPLRVQGVGTDSAGNLWISSFGNDSVYVFPLGNPEQSSGVQQYKGSQPFGMHVTRTGAAWVTNGGGFDGSYPSSVAKFELNDQGAAERKFLKFVGKALKSLASDSYGNVWVASQGDSKIYGYRPDGTQFGSFSGGGINGPWGVAVDGEDHIWIANFGPLQPGSNFTTGRVSKLCGANPAARPHGKATGAPLSPSTGYTLPSAGSQVLLHDGTPLYGSGGPRSFTPLMRQTGLSIDRAGNLWTVNNWKPNFNTDVRSNPGGDGIVIFVGLAAPPAVPQ